MAFLYGRLYEVVTLKIIFPGASLVAQWLRVHLPMQGTRVRAPVREDPTCRGAAGPARPERPAYRKKIK